MSEDPLTRKLLAMHREDPAKLTAMENEIKALKARALEAKEANKPSTLKDCVVAQDAALRKELESLRAQRAALQAQEARLTQLTSVGDEAAIVQFFEEQGMSRDDIRRAACGDADAKIAALRQPAVESEEARRALALAEKLGGVLTGEDCKDEVVVPVVEPPQRVVVQPDVWQRQPTATDMRLIVTVCLPKLASAKEAELDIAEKQLRLSARIDDSEYYMISLPLGKRVQPQRAKASWSAKKRQLEVALPLA